MMVTAISKCTRDEVTETMMLDAAKLFSEHYGIWGDKGFGRKGSRVRMSPARLREQFLPDNSRGTYVHLSIGGTLAGHAFGCRWEVDGRQVCWVTQLVVHSNFRERNIATQLLMNLVEPEDDVVGIMSSHPAACRTLSKAIGDSQFANVNLTFGQENAASIMAASPIEYVRDAELRGSLFDENDSSGLVSGVDSSFYVDHGEPLEALKRFKQRGVWSLGELPDGHEFLLVLERPKTRRTRTTSTRID